MKHAPRPRAGHRRYFRGQPQQFDGAIWVPATIDPHPALTFPPLGSTRGQPVGGSPLPPAGEPRHRRATPWWARGWLRLLGNARGARV
jgi:hypothetical protein